MGEPAERAAGARLRHGPAGASEQKGTKSTHRGTALLGGRQGDTHRCTHKHVMHMFAYPCTHVHTTHTHTHTHVHMVCTHTCIHTCTHLRTLCLALAPGTDMATPRSRCLLLPQLLGPVTTPLADNCDWNSPSPFRQAPSRSDRQSRWVCVLTGPSPPQTHQENPVLIDALEFIEIYEPVRLKLKQRGREREERRRRKGAGEKGEEEERKCEHRQKTAAFHLPSKDMRKRTTHPPLRHHHFKAETG